MKINCTQNKYEDEYFLTKKLKNWINIVVDQLSFLIIYEPLSYEINLKFSSLKIKIKIHILYDIKLKKRLHFFFFLLYSWKIKSRYIWYNDKIKVICMFWKYLKTINNDFCKTFWLKYYFIIFKTNIYKSIQIYREWMFKQNIKGLITTRTPYSTNGNTSFV